MVTRFNRRKFLVYGSATLGTSMLLKACGSSTTTDTGAADGDTEVAAGDGETIKVGILHSL
ncbi:MAG: urea ABC transporter substrate-binding protein, partial [Nodosilinea sp.]